MCNQGCAGADEGRNFATTTISPCPRHSGEAWSGVGCDLCSYKRQLKPELGRKGNSPVPGQKLTEKQNSSNLMTEKSKRKTDGSLEGGT